MILTSSVPIVCILSQVSHFPFCSPRISRRKPYILRTSGLQVHRAREELLQHGEKPVALQQALETGRELQVKLHVPPVALADPRLHHARELGQQYVYNLGLARVGDEYDARQERRLERLLNGQLQD